MSVQWIEFDRGIFGSTVLKIKGLFISGYWVDHLWDRSGFGKICHGVFRLVVGDHPDHRSFSDAGTGICVPKTKQEIRP